MSFTESYPLYTLEIISDIALGIILGVSINKFVNFIGKKFSLGKYRKLIIQLILITMVLYIVKVDSKHWYTSWKGQTSYGVAFSVAFIGTQRNIIEFFEGIYIDEKN